MNERRQTQFLVPLDKFQPLNHDDSTKKFRPKILQKSKGYPYVFFQFFGQKFFL